MNGLEKDSYTLDEIAEMLQVSKGAVCNMAKRHGIKHSTLRKGRSLLSVYNIDDVNKLVSLSRPKKLQYTTIEFAAKAAVTPPTIRNIARKLGIRPKEKLVYPGGRIKVFNSKEAQIILANINKPEQKENKRTLRLDPVNHPYVKDPKCFILSWFPDPVPKCFKDMDMED